MRSFLRDDELYGKILEDWRSAPITEAQQALLRFSVKLSQDPQGMSQDDVEDLRGHGYDDTDILHINQVTSYFNFINRMADGLGVVLEPEYLDDAAG